MRSGGGAVVMREKARRGLCLLCLVTIHNRTPESWPTADVKSTLSLPHVSRAKALRRAAKLGAFNVQHASLTVSMHKSSHDIQLEIPCMPRAVGATRAAPSDGSVLY